MCSPADAKSKWIMQLGMPSAAASTQHSIPPLVHMPPHLASSVLYGEQNFQGNSTLWKYYISIFLHCSGCGWLTSLLGSVMLAAHLIGSSAATYALLWLCPAVHAQRVLCCQGH
jgi:hypothetical protein